MVWVGVRKGIVMISHLEDFGVVAVTAPDAGDSDPLGIKPKAVRTIWSWDLSEVRHRLLKEGVCGEHEVDAWIIEYRKFMQLVYENKGALAISRKIDEVWHCHILFTKDYHAFSKAVNGEYIHHQPVLSEAVRGSMKPNYDALFSAYRQTFGEPNPDIWPSDDQICKCDMPGGCTGPTCHTPDP